MDNVRSKYLLVNCVGTLLVIFGFSSEHLIDKSHPFFLLSNLIAGIGMIMFLVGLFLYVMETQRLARLERESLSESKRKGKREDKHDASGGRVYRANASSNTKDSSSRASHDDTTHVATAAIMSSSDSSSCSSSISSGSSLSGGSSSFSGGGGCD